MMAVGVLGLARVQSYYGLLLRGGDAQYYYALAHSLVFDQDLDITNDLRLTSRPVDLDPALDGTWSEVRRRADGGFQMKHPLGLSLIEVPPMVAGLAIRKAAEAMGYRTTAPPGYSPVEIFSVAVGLLVVTAAGLTAVFLLTAEICGRWPAAVGVAACWFGTSLFYYTAVHALMAHAASFGVLALLLASSRPLWQGRAVNRSIALVGVGLAATFLLRPQQLLVALFLLPILLKTARTRPVREWGTGAAIGLAVCLVAVALQVGMNYSQFGVLTPNGYSASGQSFLLPGGPRPAFPFYYRLGVVLFDESRGLLIFSPVVVVAAIGFLRYWRRVPAYLWPAVGNAVAQLLVIAAWRPLQGDSFGARMWADNAFVVAFGLAFVLGGASGAGRWATATATVTCVIWTVYLMAQFMGVIS